MKGLFVEVAKGGSCPNCGFGRPPHSRADTQIQNSTWSPGRVLQAAIKMDAAGYSPRRIEEELLLATKNGPLTEAARAEFRRLNRQAFQQAGARNIAIGGIVCMLWVGVCRQAGEGQNVGGRFFNSYQRSPFEVYKP